MKNKGFTLVELLLVVTITTVMITSIFGLLVSTRQSTDLNEAQIEVKEYAQRALDRIAKEIRLSHPTKIRITSSIGWTTENPSSGTVINFQIPVGVYNTSLDLTGAYGLKWGCANPNGENVEGHYLAYSLNTSTNYLLRSDYVNTNGTGAVTKTVAPYISAILFSRTDTGSDFIHIEVTARKSGPRGYVTQTLKTDVKLKNS